MFFFFRFPAELETKEPTNQSINLNENKHLFRSFFFQDSGLMKKNISKMSFESLGKHIISRFGEKKNPLEKKNPDLLFCRVRHFVRKNNTLVTIEIFL